MDNGTAMAKLVIDSGPEAMEKVATSLYDMLPTHVRLVIRTLAALIGMDPEELVKALCGWAISPILQQIASQRKKRIGQKCRVRRSIMVDPHRVGERI